MDTKREEITVIEMLETSERLIARLYKTFAERLEDQNALWNKMAEEENKHASMVRTLEQEIQEGSLRLNKKLRIQLSQRLMAQTSIFNLSAGGGKAGQFYPFLQSFYLKA